VDAVADLVVLDADLRVGTVLHAGMVVAQASRTGSDGV
jgi:hypothetical protein